MYSLYEKLIEAYKANDEGTIGAASLNWIGQAKENPFPENTAAYDLFFKAKMAWVKWQNNGIDARRNRVRAKEYVSQIAAMGIPNPYQPEDPQPVEEEKPAEPELIHVLGVVPEPVEEHEENIEPEIHPVAEQKIEEKQPEKVNYEPAKNNQRNDRNNDKRQFFGKKKK